MAYRDLFISKCFQHLWELDSNTNDPIGTVNATNTGGILTRSEIVTDATNFYSTNGVTDRLTIPNTADINNSDQERKLVLFWFNVDQFVRFFYKALQFNGDPVPDLHSNQDFILVFEQRIN